MAAVTFSSKHGAARFFPILKIAGDAVVSRAPVALTKAVVLVGRRWGVHLPLASKEVSKLHALIVKDKDRIYIRDLASRNRLFVNGQTVRETDLGTGDVVKVGPYNLHCASGFTEPDPNTANDPRAPEAALEINGGVAHAPLLARAVLIGTRDECDVVLADDDASPVHAVIFELDGKRHLRDLGSASSTFVNGAKIHQQQLNLGDEIRIGQTRLRYLAADDVPAADDEAPHHDGVGSGLSERLGHLDVAGSGLEVLHDEHADDDASTASGVIHLHDDAAADRLQVEHDTGATSGAVYDILSLHDDDAAAPSPGEITGPLDLPAAQAAADDAAATDDDLIEIEHAPDASDEISGIHDLQDEGEFDPKPADRRHAATTPSGDVSGVIDPHRDDRDFATPGASPSGSPVADIDHEIEASLDPAAASAEQHDDDDHHHEDLVTLSADPDHPDTDHPGAGLPAPAADAHVPPLAAAKDDEITPEDLDLSHHAPDPDDIPIAVGTTGVPAASKDEFPHSARREHTPGNRQPTEGNPPPTPPGLRQSAPPSFDRPLGLIDAAVHAAATPHPDAQHPPIDSTAFVSIPLVPMAGPDSAVGGLPLPPGHAGYGEFDPPAATPVDIAAHKPMSPEETIIPESADDPIVDDPAAAADHGDEPAHPLFELVRQLEDATAPGGEARPTGKSHSAHPDQPAPRPPDAVRPPAPAAADDDELAALLKLDGADAAPTPGGPDAPGVGPRRAMVRRLDRIVHELSDRVADLASTWKQVKETRPPSQPGKKEKPTEP